MLDSNFMLNSKFKFFRVDAEREYIAFMSGGLDASSDAANPILMSDTNFFASGSIGSKGGGTRGTAVFGGDVVRAGKIMHGKTSPIEHTNQGVFTGLPSPFLATRYHSLVVDNETLPECLRVTARSDDGEIMGLRHTEHPTEGVQFHPESILTEHGLELMRNWLEDKG